MKRRGPIWICLLGGTALAISARTALADTKDNPYEVIVEHNVFKLKPPTPAKEPPKKEEAPPSDITLTGITTIFGDKRALLKVKVPPHPPKPPKEEYYTLSVGQRDGGIELLAVDVAANTARVNNHGKVETLTLQDTPKLSSANFKPAAPHQPPRPGPHPQVIRGPGAPPPKAAAAEHNNAGQRGGLGVMQSNNGTPDNSGNLAQNGIQNALGMNANLNAMPTRDVRTSQISPPNQNLTAAQQEILMEVSREKTAQQVMNGTMPPLPPTAATPPGTDPRLTGGVKVPAQ